MKIDKNSVLLAMILAVIIVFIQYEHSKLKDHKLPSKAISSFDETVFDFYHKKYDTDKSLNQYWGYKKELTASEKEAMEKAAKDAELKAKDDAKRTKVTKPNNENVLCISESCYRLLGVHYKYKTPMITMYNKDLKEKTKNYKNKDLVGLVVRINKIYSNKVEFENLETKEKYYFEQFDVNQTKYKPKEINE